MTLHPYVDSPQDKLRTLDAICHSSSGRLKIRFPSTWEGSVTSGVRKDRVRHEWEGLRVLESETFFNAIKGNGIGRLVITGPTAGVELVGESVPGGKAIFQAVPPFTPLTPRYCPLLPKHCPLLKCLSKTLSITQIFCPKHFPLTQVFVPKIVHYSISLSRKWSITQFLVPNIVHYSYICSR